MLPIKLSGFEEPPAETDPPAETLRILPVLQTEFCYNLSFTRYFLKRACIQKQKSQEFGESIKYWWSLGVTSLTAELGMLEVAAGSLFESGLESVQRPSYITNVSTKELADTSRPASLTGSRVLVEL